MMKNLLSLILFTTILTGQYSVEFSEGSYISINDLNGGSGLGLNELSIQTHIKHQGPAPSGHTRIFASDEGSGGDRFVLSFRWDSKIEFYCSGNAYCPSSFTVVSESIPAGEWVNIVLTISSQEVKIYINDELSASESIDNFSFEQFQDVPYIGGHVSSGALSFPGKIGNLSIWGIALTPDYFQFPDTNTLLSGLEFDLLSAWNLNEGTGEIANNIFPNNIIGQIVDASWSEDAPLLYDECGVLYGDNSTCTDCAGDINGVAYIDDCGVCNGGNTNMDECGECFGDGIDEGACDCNGSLDTCELCLSLNSANYGDCDMELGWGWTGETCELISGCGSGNDSEWFFESFEECKEGCQNCKILNSANYGDCDMELGWGWTGETCELISGCGAGVDEPWFYDSYGICSNRCNYSIDVYGCTGFDSCNYNPEATIDDGSCIYPEMNYDCYGNCTVEVDCAGTCGGILELDCCGSCGGDNSTCSNCCGAPFNEDCTSDCYENPETGECCYNADVDECGVCDGDGTTCIEILGCTYQEATNYNPDAITDDGSCEFMLGDFNQDGTLNVLDIVAIVQAILGGW